MDLWKAARDKTATPAEAKPPVDSLITEVDGKATVSKDVVTVTATLKIEVLKEGWNEVLLRLGDVAITKASLDGEPARILFDAPGGGHKLLVEKKGKDPKSFVLTLTFAKAYTKAPGQNSVSFESPAAPVSRWEVHIPEAGVKVNVHPLLAATEVPPVKPAVGTDRAGRRGDGRPGVRGRGPDRAARLDAQGRRGQGPGGPGQRPRRAADRR